MPDFALEPTQTRALATALLVHGADQKNLLAKLRARAVHYANMSLAVSDEWAVLFLNNSAEEPSLPWLNDGPVFMYQLGRGCLCEVGYHPNIPDLLINPFIAKLRKTYAVQGTMALLSDHPKARLFDLSHAQKLEEIDLMALS